MRTALLCLALAGCASPMAYTDAPLAAYDRDTAYRIDEVDGGLTVVVAYSRYQFVPEQTAVMAACKQQLTSIAHEAAEKRGRRLQPIDESRLRLSMGRNGFSGVTSCSGTATVRFQ